jgi:hypothetical protein
MATTLAQRVLALSAELYNMIYHYVFASAYTTQVCTYQTLDNTYKPPSRIQVNAASRAHFAPLYYGTTIFTLQNQNNFLTWFKNVDKKHIALLKGFR